MKNNNGSSFVTPTAAHGVLNTWTGASAVGFRAAKDAVPKDVGGGQPWQDLSHGSRNQSANVNEKVTVELSGGTAGHEPKRVLSYRPLRK